MQEENEDHDHFDDYHLHVNAKEIKYMKREFISDKIIKDEIPEEIDTVEIIEGKDFQISHLNIK
jgi:hypothetical protein